MAQQRNEPARSDVTAIDWKRTAKEQNERADRIHHSVLDKDVLRGALPVRARTLPHRSALAEARDREQRFRLAAPAYARAIDAAGPLENSRQIRVDGLAWWVPLVRPDDPLLVERAVRHQDFPYRLLTQTRELALGGVMIDIGANVGRMSIPRVILGDATVAYCVEPDPLNYECLVRNVRDNHLRGLVLPDRLAIGAANRTVRFERTRSAGGHRVIADGRETRNPIIEVQAVTLDAWVERVGIDVEQVTFVKLDAQGSEVQILRGARRVLSHRHIAWQIEVDPALLTAARTSTAELYALIREHFTHFIDLSRHATGARLRPVAELEQALAYVGGDDAHTDVLVATLEMPAAGR